ncbi:MAG: ester cyclase [Pseudomonadota bacterium]
MSTFTPDATGATAEQINLIEHLFYNGFSGGNLDVIEEVFHPDIEFDSPGLPAGLEGIKKIVTLNNTAMSEWRFTIEDLFGHENKVVVRWSAKGVHTGSFMDEAPTGKPVSLTGQSIIKIEQGQITADWMVADMMSFLSQLGIVQPPG